MNEQLFKRFPWGMMPVNSVGNSVWRKFCMFHAKWSANQLTRVDAKILFTDIVDGGAAAFRCSINGIFRHILMIKHEHGADAVCEDFIDHSGETEMQKMFQERLTDFYTQAIQRHNSSPTHSCTYSLHKIDQAALSDVELIIGARRGVPLPKSAFQFKLLNTTVIIDPDDDNYFSSQDASVRVVVDVQCQGNVRVFCSLSTIFFVLVMKCP